MKLSPFVQVFTLTLVLQFPAIAHNNYFLPGDSFFSISITREVIEPWTKNQKDHFDFEYSRFDGKYFAEGNLGYSRVKLHGIDQKFRDALTKAYWRFTALQRPLFRLESDDQDIFTQTNGVVALIYNRDFAGSPGLKFNEDWQIEGLRRYAGLFKKAEPVIEDWKLGPEVIPLKVAEAIPPLAHIPMENEQRQTMKAPVEVNSSDIKVMLVGFAKQDGFEATQTCPNLQNIYDNIPGTEYMVVDQNGFTTFSCNEKRIWKQTRTNIP